MPTTAIDTQADALIRRIITDNLGQHAVAATDSH
jgi:hypothetical protein